MFVWILSWLSSHAAGPFEADGWAVFETISFRGSLAAGVSLSVAMIFGGRWIGWLKHRLREPIRSDSPRLDALHKAKQATPTMGGIFIVTGLVAAILAFADLANLYVLLALWVVLGLAGVGAVDDLVKIFRPQNGLSVGMKLAAQTAVALVPAVVVYLHHQSIPHALELNMPAADVGFELGWWFVPWAVLVIVGSSNAVNLTDGLDGLAGGCLIFAAAALAVLAYSSDQVGTADYLGVSHFVGASELVVVAGGMIGGLLGFLWFNCHPARVFMGDTGSLSLGGLLGLIALVIRQEILLVVIGGVFVAEALSVIVQVGYFKWRRKRLFLCAPLHHHYQFKGWSETRIVARFWITALFCAIVGLALTRLTSNKRSASRMGESVASHLLTADETANTKILHHETNKRMSTAVREPQRSSAGHLGMAVENADSLSTKSR